MKKRLIGTLVALAITAVTFGSGVVQTYAAEGNYRDQPFAYNLLIAPRFTEKQIKNTTSSVYISVSASPSAYIEVQAQGEYGASWINKTVGTNARVPAGTAAAPAQRRIRAGLLEANNYQPMNVRVYFWPNGKDGMVRGVWSPDCMGNYPAVN